MASKEGVLIDFRTNSFDNLNSNPIEAIEDIMDTYGDDVNYDYSDPNYNLYASHLKAAVITQNAIYMAGSLHGEVDHPTFIEYLESIILFLDNIEPGEDKLQEFIKAKQIAEQALEQEVSRWDPILDELHEVLHELDEYYNVKPFIDVRTSHDGMIIFPDDETID